MLASSGLMYASKTLSKPLLPFLAMTQEFSPKIGGLNLVDTRSIFGDMYNRTFTPELDDVFQRIKTYLLTLEMYTDGSLLTVDLCAIADQRNFTQYCLLSLPSGGSFDDIFKVAHPWYELCRLCCLILGVGVVFPLPARAAPIPTLVRLVKHEIGLHLPYAAAESGVVLLWSLVIGGIAAINMVERSWFVLALHELALGMGICRWKEARALAKSMLWLDFACNSAGERLWYEVVAAQGSGTQGYQQFGYFDS